MNLRILLLLLCWVCSGNQCPSGGLKECIKETCRKLGKGCLNEKLVDLCIDDCIEKCQSQVSHRRLQEEDPSLGQNQCLTTLVVDLDERVSAIEEGGSDDGVRDWIKRNSPCVLNADHDPNADGACVCLGGKALEGENITEWDGEAMEWTGECSAAWTREEMCQYRVDGINNAWHGRGEWEYTKEDDSLKHGYITEGGHDIFDRGSALSTSLCHIESCNKRYSTRCPYGDSCCGGAHANGLSGGNGGLYPYIDNCSTSVTKCYGNGSSFQMNLHEKFFFMQTVTTEDLVFGYEGACGNCQDGAIEYTEKRFSPNGEWTTYIRCNHRRDDNNSSPLTMIFVRGQDEDGINWLNHSQPSGECQERCHNEYLENVNAGTEIILVTFKTDPTKPDKCNKSEYDEVIDAVTSTDIASMGAWVKRSTPCGPYAKRNNNGDCACIGNGTTEWNEFQKKWTGECAQPWTREEVCNNRVNGINNAWSSNKDFDWTNEEDTLSHGYITDGGQDTFDRGGALSTSLCHIEACNQRYSTNCPYGGDCCGGAHANGLKNGNGGVYPYIDGCSTGSTKCYGQDSSFQMNLHKKFFFMQTVTTEDLVFGYEGACGNCNSAIEYSDKRTTPNGEWTTYIRCNHRSDDTHTSPLTLIFVRQMGADKNINWISNSQATGECGERCHNEYLENVKAGSEVVLVTFKTNSGSSDRCNKSEYDAVIDAVTKYSMYLD